MDTKSLFTIARLVDELDGVDGRTRLQKIVHLLSGRFPNDFRQSFTLHYFGPFSSELANQLDFLSSAKLVDEQPPKNGTEGPFRYRIANEEARNRIREAFGTGRPPWSDLAKELSREERMTLEALSTLVYLHTGTRQPLEACRQRFASIKPHLSNEFERACELATKFGMTVPSDA